MDEELFRKFLRTFYSDKNGEIGGLVRKDYIVYQALRLDPQRIFRNGKRGKVLLEKMPNFHFLKYFTPFGYLYEDEAENIHLAQLFKKYVMRYPNWRDWYLIRDFLFGSNRDKLKKIIELSFPSGEKYGLQVRKKDVVLVFEDVEIPLGIFEDQRPHEENLQKILFSTFYLAGLEPNELVFYFHLWDFKLDYVTLFLERAVKDPIYGVCDVTTKTFKFQEKEILSRYLKIQKKLTSSLVLPDEYPQMTRIWDTFWKSSSKKSLESITERIKGDKDLKESLEKFLLKEENFKYKSNFLMAAYFYLSAFEGTPLINKEVRTNAVKYLLLDFHLNPKKDDEELVKLLRRYSKKGGHKAVTIELPVKKKKIIKKVKQNRMVL